MEGFISLFGLISLGLIIENFPWSDRNINSSSRSIKREEQLIKEKSSRLTSCNTVVNFFVVNIDMRVCSFICKIGVNVWRRVYVCL